MKKLFLLTVVALALSARTGYCFDEPGMPGSPERADHSADISLRDMLRHDLNGPYLKGVPTSNITAPDVVTDPAALEQRPAARTSPKVMDKSAGLATIELARDYADGYLRAAYKEVDSTYSKWFSASRYGLSNATIQFPKEGYDFAACTEKTLGFVYLYDKSRIYLCGYALDNLRSQGLAQVLVHESAHLAGLRNECDATLIEITAMLFGRGSLVFRNGYVEKCGYSKYAKVD